MEGPIQIDIDSVSIPTLPEVARRLSAMVDDPRVGLDEIGRAVGQDPAIAARLLRIANSAVVGLRERVASVEHAAAVLGVRAVRNLALQASAIGMFERLGSTPDLDLLLVWKHAGLTAQLCQLLAANARERLPLVPEEYYSCGLLHDLGKLVLAGKLGPDYLGVLRLARVRGEPVHRVEAEVLGFDHVQIGSRVAMRWGLPGVLAVAIKFHHGPKERIAGDPGVALVAIADQVAYRVQCGDAATPGARLAPRAQRFLGVDREAFAGIVRTAFEIWPTLQI